MIIYKIQNKINNKIYIGQTKYDVSARIREHISSRAHIGNALRKYGLQSFDVSVIDSANDREVLSDKEIYWICFYDCKHPNGYNHTDGGEGLINPSIKVRQDISKTLKEFYKNHSPVLGFIGHNHSDATKKKISCSVKKIMSSSEAKAKVSSFHKGKVISEETKKKMSLSKIGKKRKDSHLFSERMKKYVDSPNYINPMKGKKRPDLSERNKLRSNKIKGEEI
jgi:group I intron endonuclease